MKYRNKHTGTIAEPTTEIAALNFAHNSHWEEIPENFEDEGEVENECLPSEQTATSLLNTPTNISKNGLEQEAATEAAGKASARKKGKVSSKPPAEN